ncbi:hypothetical protein B7486_71165, partial [cyanobacterium TDX16]
MTSPPPSPVDELAIRPEVPADHAAVAEVVAAAFGGPVEARLVEAIRASVGYRPELSLVAERAGEVVGHVMISEATVVDGCIGAPAATLSPLAVHPDHQGEGVGAALVEAVLARADAAGEGLVLLEGDPRYYGRFGFEDARPLGIRFELPDWAPPEAGQVRRL